MNLTDEQRAKLNADLPREDIKEREGGGNKKLSFVEGWRVIDVLNSIIGAGNWSYRTTVTKEYEGTNEKGQYLCTYLGRCVLTVGDCVIEDVGAGQGQDKRAGEAIEKAAKEAATDALKRCAKSLGRRMGLALYDKTQEHVEDGATPAEQPSGIGSQKLDALVREILAADNADKWKAVTAKRDALVPQCTADEVALIKSACADLQKRVRKVA